MGHSATIMAPMSGWGGFRSRFFIGSVRYYKSVIP